MKKISVLLTAAIMCACLLSACSNSKPAQNDDSSTTSTTAGTSDTSQDIGEASDTASDITGKILSEVPIQSAVEKKLSDVENYYDIDTATLKDASFYICGSGAYPDEIAVFEFNDAAAAEAGKTAIDTRLSDQLALFKDYTPDEVYKLEGAKTGVKGNYAYFFGCADNDKALELFNSLVG